MSHSVCLVHDAAAACWRLKPVIIHPSLIPTAAARRLCYATEQSVHSSRRTHKCSTEARSNFKFAGTIPFILTLISDLSRPPRGVITPQMRHPQPSEVQRGYQGGVYVIVMEWVKYWHEPIYLLYETNNAQNLVILFSGILLKLLPPDVIFCS